MCPACSAERAQKINKYNRTGNSVLLLFVYVKNFISVPQRILYISFFENAVHNPFNISLLASMAPWSNFDFHESFPLHNMIFIVTKDSLDD